MLLRIRRVSNPTEGEETMSYKHPVSVCAREHIHTHTHKQPSMNSQSLEILKFITAHHTVA